MIISPIGEYQCVCKRVHSTHTISHIHLVLLSLYMGSIKSKKDTKTTFANKPAEREYKLNPLTTNRLMSI